MKTGCLAVAVIFLIALASSQFSPSFDSYKERKQRENTGTSKVAPLEAPQQEKPQPDVKEAPPQVGSQWRYSTTKDKMGRGDVRLATVESSDFVNFNFPYNGQQRASLALRAHPEFGKDVMVLIEKGQFLCQLGSCAVSVRFDSGKVQKFNASEPSDNRTTMIFIKNYERFVSAVSKASTVTIEAEFYQEGFQSFTFDVGGLKWP